MLGYEHNLILIDFSVQFLEYIKNIVTFEGGCVGEDGVLLKQSGGGWTFNYSKPGVEGSIPDQ